MEPIFKLFAAPRPLELSMRSYAALITLDHVYVCRTENLLALEQVVLDIDGSREIIALVVPRLCTRHSMDVEAQRIHDELTDEIGLCAASFTGRAHIGSYDEIKYDLAVYAADAMITCEQRDAAERDRAQLSRAHTERIANIERTRRHAVSGIRARIPA